MRFLEKVKDGGPESPVTGYVLVEIKSLFSIVLLHFAGTREAFHSHAFNAWTIWLKGRVQEHIKGARWCHDDCPYWNSGDTKYTPRGLMHKIVPTESAWALSFRGPWQETWQEYKDGEFITLTHGRKVIG